MPSDLESISGCVCVGCGRGSDHVAFKRLNTYSRAFGCLDCFLRYSNCATCGHEKHAYVPIIQQLYHVKPRACHCGCTEYRHGLEAEFDRQFSAHTGKEPEQRRCLKCANYFNALQPGQYCPTCQREIIEIANG